MLLVLNLPLVGLWARLLPVPRPYLYAGILIFSSLGGYGLNACASTCCVLLGRRRARLPMRRFDYPVGPAVIGLILGPIAEEQLRRALAISQGDPSALISSPFAATVYILLALGVVVTVALRRRSARSPYPVH